MNPCLPVLLSFALLVSACSIGDQQGGADRRATPSVVVASAEVTPLMDSIEATGTARANEQADLNSTVTERIAAIHFRDGQRVQKGAVIAELVQTEQAAMLAERRARLTEAQLQLTRLKQLRERGFATQARVDEQQAAVDIARASSQQAGSQIADRVIRAPFTGWLSLRQLSPGAVVNAGTTIARITDHSRIKLDFTVPEIFVPVVRPGLAIDVTASAFPGETFRGEIASIDPALDPVTRSAQARALLPNPDLRLRPGMMMTVHIQSRPRQGLTVPESAIIGEGRSAYVWKVSADNDASRTNVETGLRRDGRVEILSGLVAGDRIVTEGSVKLRGPGPIEPVAGNRAKEADAEQAGAA